MFNFRKISINRVVGKIVELGTPSLVLIVAMEVCIRRAVSRCIGKNQIGESVASGLYFYTLTAGEFTATRKLLIEK